MPKMCPNCNEVLEITYKPTSPFLQRIGLANGLFCARCDTRLKPKVSRLSLLFYLPYSVVLLWNVFVNIFGSQQFGLTKVDTFWVLMSLLVFVGGLIQQIRKGGYTVYSER